MSEVKKFADELIKSFEAELMVLEDLANKVSSPTAVCELCLMRKIIAQIKVKAATYNDFTDDGWILCDDCQPDKSGIYVCTCRYTDDALDTRFIKLYRRYEIQGGDLKWEPEFDKNREIEIIAWKDWEDVKPYGKPML